MVRAARRAVLGTPALRRELGIAVAAVVLSIALRVLLLRSGVDPDGAYWALVAVAALAVVAGAVSRLAGFGAVRRARALRMVVPDRDPDSMIAAARAVGLPGVWIWLLIVAIPPALLFAVPLAGRADDPDSATVATLPTVLVGLTAGAVGWSLLLAPLIAAVADLLPGGQPVRGLTQLGIVWSIIALLIAAPFAFGLTEDFSPDSGLHRLVAVLVGVAAIVVLTVSAVLRVRWSRGGSRFDPPVW